MHWHLPHPTGPAFASRPHQLLCRLGGLRSQRMAKELGAATEDDGRYRARPGNRMTNFHFGPWDPGFKSARRHEIDPGYLLNRSHLALSKTSVTFYMIILCFYIFFRSCVPYSSDSWVHLLNQPHFSTLDATGAPRGRGILQQCIEGLCHGAAAAVGGVGHDTAGVCRTASVMRRIIGSRFLTG